MATVTSIRSYCDRCGQERLPFSSSNPEFLQSFISIKTEWAAIGLSGNGGGTDSYNYDLCKSCTQKLLKFLKNENKEQTK